MEKAGAIVSSCLNGVAQLPFGQTFIHLLDRSLWIIEKTAQWSLPDHEISAEENGKSFKKMELVRPVPWIFFLPAIVILRLFRTSCNVAAFVVGYQKIEPSDIVKYLQKSRRRLRVIKTNAIKATRQRKSGNLKENSQLCNVNRSLLRKIQSALSSLSCLDASKNVQLSPATTRIQVRFNEMTPEENTKIQDLPKRKFNQVSSDYDGSDDETVGKKLDRLALENSSDDHDFNPENISSSESSSDENEEDDEFSETEVEDIKKDILRNADNDEISASDLTSFAGYNINFEAIKCRDVIDSKMSKIATSMEHKDFYTPIKNHEDGETAFYSPISSKSVSPEPGTPTIINDHAEEVIIQENGENKIDKHTTGVLNDSDGLEKSNGHDKINKQHNQSTLKSMQKGKRGGVSNRKKK